MSPAPNQAAKRDGGRTTRCGRRRMIGRPLTRTLRRDDAVCRKPVAHPIVRQRAAEQISLAESTAGPGGERTLSLGLDALSNDLHAERVGKADDAVNQAPLRSRSSRGLDEQAIQFDHVER